jgi:hypothetical protein
MLHMGQPLRTLSLASPPFYMQPSLSMTAGCVVRLILGPFRTQCLKIARRIGSLYYWLSGPHLRARLLAFYCIHLTSALEEGMTDKTGFCSCLLPTPWLL